MTHVTLQTHISYPSAGRGSSLRFRFHLGVLQSDRHTPTVQVILTTEHSGITDCSSGDPPESSPDLFKPRRSKITNTTTNLPAAYAQQVEAHPVLSPEKEYVLGLLACSGDIDARNRLVLCNQRYIVKMACDYAAKHSGVDAEDIIAEANIGMLNAASSYDPRNGVRFLSYAKKWIIHSVARYLYEEAGAIRFPRHQADALRKIRTAVADGASTVDEISRTTGISTDDVKMLSGYLMPVVSLDTPVEGADGCVLGDLILPPDRKFEKSTEQIVLRDILAKLPEKYRDVLMRHFGVFGRPQESLAKIAARLKVSKEAVRKIKDKALAECRRCA